MQKLSPGDIFHNRFRIVKELGVGGMGVVYHAMQTDVSRDVALKLLRLDKFNTEISQQRFLREFKILSKLSQENIMAFYALSITPDGIPYAVCEYIDGRNLSEIMKAEGVLSWRRTLNLAIQIARGLGFAHSIGVVHRDLKPSNIMVLHKDDSENVKLIDFGLARAIESGAEQKLTGTGLVIGTLHYMSPEQITNQALDGRSDIYSLACVLFECMSGEKLFDAENALSIAHLHTQADPKDRLSVLRKTVPAAFISILEKMLAKSPDQRPASMSQLIPCFESLLKNSDDTGVAFGDSNMRRGNSSRWIILIPCAIVLAFSVVIGIRFSSNPTPSSSEKINSDPTDKIPRSGKALAVRASKQMEKDPSSAVNLLNAWLYKNEKHGASLQDRVDVLTWLARAEDRLGNKIEAEKHIRKAVELAKDIQLDSRENRHLVICALETEAEILSELENNSESLKAVNKELQLYLTGEPTSADTEDIDVCLRTLSKHGKFDMVAKSALELVPKLANNMSFSGTAGILMLAGDSYLCADHPDKALEQYKQALSNLDNVEVIHELATRRIQGGRIVAPVSDFQENSTELSPSLGPLLSQIAERLYFFDQHLAKTHLKRAIVLSEKCINEGGKVDATSWLDMGNYAQKLNLKDETLLCLKNGIHAYKKSEKAERNLGAVIFESQCKRASALLSFDEADESVKVFDNACASFRKSKTFSYSLLLREKFKFACSALAKKESIGKKYYDEAFSELSKHPESKTLSVLAWCSYAQQVQGINPDEMMTMASESTKNNSFHSDLEDYCRTLIATGHSSDALKLLNTGWGSLDGRIMSYLLLAQYAKERGNCSESRLYCSKAFDLSRVTFPALTLPIERELLSKLQQQGCK